MALYSGRDELDLLPEDELDEDDDFGPDSLELFDESDNSPEVVEQDTPGVKSQDTALNTPPSLEISQVSDTGEVAPNLSEALKNCSHQPPV